MQTQIATIGSFVGGLNTEQPQLADQIQYTADELNCQLLPDGTRARRYGIDREISGRGISQSLFEASEEEEDEGEGFIIEYTQEGQHVINVPVTGVYTVTMVGAGSYEGWYQGSRGARWGFTAQGAAGAGIKFTAVLEAGEYSVWVGHFYGYGERVESKHHGYFRTGGDTAIIREGVIHVQCTGGSGQGFYPKNGYYEGPQQAYSGDVNIYSTPSAFAIIDRTTNHQLQYENSFITGDTTGYGAINHGGYFKITKGYDTDTNIQIDTALTNAYYWANYDKKGSDCIVLQQGSVLKFFKAERPYDSHQISVLDTSSRIKDGDKFKKYNFSSGEGFLLCVSEFSEPFYVKLDDSTGFATLEPITLKIRDIAGVDDNLNVDETPGTLTAQHQYNLLNQGWDNTKITAYHNQTSMYPSNALVWWYGKDGNGDFNAEALTKVYFGTTPAPKGHYILDYFDQDRSTASGVANLPKVTKDRYCVDTAFFAGRFFYLTSSTVLFSQIVKEDARNINKCYQDADPTSQRISDIIATDGGEIIFQELGYGKALKKYPIGMLVFGTKAVYSITSTSGSVFSATQYLTQFVTHAGAISGKSVVGVEDVVFYWSPQGIYKIVVDKVSGTQAIASSVSANTIQHWYNNLPGFSKENCVGVYDYTNRRVVWMYPTDENDLENRNGLLVYYLDFDAFMPSKVSDGGQLITAFETVLPTYLVPSIGLYAGTEEVIAGSDDVIVKDFGEEYGRNFSVCYVGYIKSYDKLFFCDFYSREFIDWSVSMYPSYTLSYPITFGSTWVKKYTPTLQCYFLRTEEDQLTDGSYLAPSSCYVRARWKWGETAESCRWDLTQEGYIRLPKFMEFKYVNGKIRVRGSGPAVQLMFESKDDNDFKLSSTNLEIRE